MKRTAILTWTCMAWLCAPAPSALAQTQGNSHSKTHIMAIPTYHCHPVDRDLILTGKVDDPLWQQAEVIHLNNPIDGQPGRYRTTARMLYSARCFYIAYRYGYLGRGQCHHLARPGAVEWG